MVCNGISILSGFAHPFFAPNESLFWHCYGAMSMLNWIKYACTFQKNPPNDYITPHPSFFACRFSACTNGVSMEKKNVFISQAHTISACRKSACTNAISMYLKYTFLC